MSHNWGVHVEVTTDDIAHGVRSSSVCCPIALAATRAMRLGAGTNNQDRYVSVRHDGTAGLYDRHRKGFWYKRREALLPSDALAWLRSFDKELPVQPFSFVLELLT